MNSTERMNDLLTKAVQIGVVGLMAVGFAAYLTLWMMGVI